VWALIDTESRSLVRVNDFELGLPTLPPLDLAIPRLRMPSELTEIGGYGVHYGDADQNLHMNNTKYPDMYSNFLPLENRMIGSITISYKNEAKLGEKLRVHRAEYDGAYYFRTLRGDGSINSEAEIRLREIKK
jgi:acyl-ACP thioesterase